MNSEINPIVKNIYLKSLSFKHELANDFLFKDLNFDFKMGNSYRIKGRSGSGKSTMLKILAGLNQKFEGEIYFDQTKLNDCSFEEFLPIRKNIGYSFDFGGLISNRTLFDNLMLPLNYHDVWDLGDRTKWVNELSQMFEFSEVLDLRPSRVSGTNRKATVVARAFVMKPRILLLDDPTTGLSPTRIENLVKLIQSAKSKNEVDFVFVISDNEAFCNSVCNEEFNLDFFKNLRKAG